MGTTVKTKTPPIDAADMAVILITAGVISLIYGALVGLQPGLLSWSWVAPVLLLAGVLCVIGGIVIESLRPKG